MSLKQRLTGSFLTGIMLLVGISSAQPLTGQMKLDAEPIFKLHASKAVSPSVVQSQPGVVGLDLLVTSFHYPLVQGVFPQTSAEHEGVQPGDLLVQINGQTTLGQSRSQIDALISDHIGDHVRLLISRDAQLKTIILTVSPAPASAGW